MQATGNSTPLNLTLNRTMESGSPNLLPLYPCVSFQSFCTFNLDLLRSVREKNILKDHLHINTSYSLLLVLHTGNEQRHSSRIWRGRPVWSWALKICKSLCMWALWALRALRAATLVFAAISKGHHCPHGDWPKTLLSLLLISTLARGNGTSLKHNTDLANGAGVSRSAKIEPRVYM
jgi:hypothetical protein